MDPFSQLFRILIVNITDSIETFILELLTNSLIFSGGRSIEVFHLQVNLGNLLFWKPYLASDLIMVYTELDFNIKGIAQQF